MALYVNLINQDVLRSDDIFTWPFAAVQLAQSIRDAFKVPSALKSIQSTTTRNDDSTSPSPPPSPTAPGFRWLSNGPHFEAHFLAYPPSAPLPSTCHIPVLCMATEKYLPVVMTSLLYQRHRILGHVTTDPQARCSSTRVRTSVCPEIVTPEEVSDTEGPPASEMSDTILTFLSQMSCSRFADTPVANDSRIFSWLLDRRVAPKSLASDPEFSREYVAMTGFIWPMTWNVRDDLPPVDAALESCIQELLASVAPLKSQNAVKLLHPDEFPVDLRILEQSSSAIFQGSRRSREKKAIGDEYEVSWRHDHDHLLFDFFIRLVQTNTGTLLGGDKSIAHFEDPQVHLTLETTLCFPESDFLQPIPEEFETSMDRLLIFDRTATRRWLNSRGNAPAATAAADREIESALGGKRKNQRLSQDFGMFPRTGKCDALGCLWVKLPNVSVEDLGQFPFIHRTPPTDEVGSNDATKASMRNDATRASKRGDATRESWAQRRCPNRSPGRGSKPKHNVEADGTAEDTVEPMTSRIERLQIGPDATLLDLPIVAVEHKKKSDHLAKTMNQLRMHLTASVKFLQTIGITNFPVYGVEADVLRGDDNLNDWIVSTPLGAWHYATILCRLANIHAGLLGERFEMAKEDLITSLRKKGKDMEGWTITHQLALLAADYTCSCFTAGHPGEKFEWVKKDLLTSSRRAGEDTAKWTIIDHPPGCHAGARQITFNTAQCSTHSHPLSLLTRRTSPDCLSEITVLTARGDEERNTNSTRLLPYQEVIDYMMTHTYEHVLVLYFRVRSQRRERSLYEETSAKRTEWRLAGSSFKASPFWSSLPPFHLATEGLRGELSQAFLST
ncbi:hypothetical protein F5J12DRAFT_785577 [Pisolithus orientalis]|uniref:uncharacterized protein n=1 Tax=Pisolithus orientalis TaxID=936130 RepID=UPI0022255137|nr:uncharacterized protein F5J12DRAFT_785577 [Pisolithus orientalis]KAI5995809.1 hypothetical protein F5J12DRAFT_785577 [Pisolithus orientalis]